jgi:DNA primase catalytic subunit
MWGKKQKMSKGLDFRHFYTVLWTDHVARVILETLATLNGRFRLEQREMAIAWRSQTTGEEGWNRSQVFHHWQEALAYLRKDCMNINFGAIFGAAARERPPQEGPRFWERKHTFHQGAGTPRGEMVLDIDLDQKVYDRSTVCACGEKRQACIRCWTTFMVPAQRVMNALLPRLGFKHWFAVFSGRRGLHYWLCDAEVIQMTREQRHRLVATLTSVPTLHSEWGREVRALLGGSNDDLSVYYPKIDAPVATDATHLHGIPLTLHPDTQVFRRVIPRGDLFDFATQRLTIEQVTPTLMKQQTELLLSMFLAEE